MQNDKTIAKWKEQHFELKELRVRVKEKHAGDDKKDFSIDINSITLSTRWNIINDELNGNRARTGWYLDDELNGNRARTRECYPKDTRTRECYPKDTRTSYNDSSEECYHDLCYDLCYDLYWELTVILDVLKLYLILQEKDQHLKAWIDGKDWSLVSGLFTFGNRDIRKRAFQISTIITKLLPQTWDTAYRDGLVDYLEFLVSEKKDLMAWWTDRKHRPISEFMLDPRENLDLLSIRLAIKLYLSIQVQDDVLDTTFDFKPFLVNAESDLFDLFGNHDCELLEILYLLLQRNLLDPIRMALFFFNFIDFDHTVLLDIYMSDQDVVELYLSSLLELIEGQSIENLKCTSLNVQECMAMDDDQDTDYFSSFQSTLLDFQPHASLKSPNLAQLITRLFGISTEDGTG